MNAQPVGLSAQLAPRQVIRVELGSVDMAIWRSASGVISAWENRCPHRGMRLSHGFVRGESLACAYHGWHYDCSGKCHKIPAHPELEPPDTIRTNRYHIEENGGVIWVDPQSIDTPNETLSETLNEILTVLPDKLIAVRSVAMDCALEPALNAFATVSFTGSHSNETNDQTVKNTSDKITSNRSIFTQPMVVAYSTDDAADGVWIAFQEVHAQSIVAHVLAISTMPSARLIAVSRWCEAVRRRAETNLIQHTSNRSVRE